jgi:hypothetical protein
VKAVAVKAVAVKAVAVKAVAVKAVTARPLLLLAHHCWTGGASRGRCG